MPSIESEVFDFPLAKRQKTAENLEFRQHPQPAGSRIFSPFRTLGMVSSTTVPFTSVRLGKSTFQITTSVGSSLQTYDVRRGLNLVFLSQPQTPETITATCAWRDRVFAAWGSHRQGSAGEVWIFKRGKKIGSLKIPSNLIEPIERLLVFGSWVVGCCRRKIEVWKSDTYEHYTTLNPPIIPGSDESALYNAAVCNVPTYVNKIFVGRNDGGVDIWNVRTAKLLYTIPPASSNAGAVTALEPAPVLSLIAVAHRNGRLSIMNVDTAQPTLLLRAASPTSEAITCITFRTDDLGAGKDGKRAGVLATASIDSGDIMFWDLNDGGRVTGILRGAHAMHGKYKGLGVNRIEFLDGQPVLVSSGMDNSLRTWIFDETPFSPIPRPLHSRRGHAAVVTALKFLPSLSDGSEFGGKWLLSASKDHSLWGFSLWKDSQNTELSQGNVEHKAKKLRTLASSNGIEDLKAPEITCIACSLNRDGGMGNTTSGPIWANPRGGTTDAAGMTGWESVITGHRGDKYARTWLWGKKKAGRWAFETGDGTEVKSVAISKCGTFALVGSAAGSIDMFNLQSGAHRQSFPPRLPHGFNKKSTPRTRFSGSRDTKHAKAVTGLMIDSLNRTVISCGLDGKVKFWDFLSGKLLDELDWHPMTTITSLRFNEASELVSFSCDDLSIRVVDLETRKLVRELWGCIGRINDFTFSNDGKWIIAASMDSLIRIWDLPTGHLIDVFRVPSTCTTLAMSSTGEFLATGHADGVGINLWTNRSLFMPVSTKNVDEDNIGSITAPTASGESGVGFIEAAFADEQEESEADGPVISTEQLSRDMVTLSMVPRSRWQTLLHLDILQERNKPKEAPKTPEKAPFFLPSLLKPVEQNPSIETLQANQDADLESLVQSTPAERSQIAKLHRADTSDGASSHFSSLLRSGDFESFVEHLKSLSPAKVDLEIRSLDPRVEDDGRYELADFVTALTYRLQSKRDFELVNAWMAVFLKIHADIIRECSQSDTAHRQLLRKALVAWSDEQQREARRLSQLVGYCRGVVGFLRSSR